MVTEALIGLLLIVEEETDNPLRELVGSDPLLSVPLLPNVSAKIQLLIK